MAITNEVSRVTYTGDGSTREFAFNALVFEKAHLEVLVDEVAVAQAGFSVTGLGAEAGVTVTYPADAGDAALGSSSSLVVRRTLPLTQPQRISNQGGFFPNVLEKALDRNAMMLQQLARRADPEPGSSGAASTRDVDASAGQVQDDVFNYVAAAQVGGTGNAVTLTPSPAIPSYAAGQRWRFKVETSSTAAVTVAVSGLAARAVMMENSVGALVNAQLVAGTIYDLVDDGTRLVVMGTSRTAQRDTAGWRVLGVSLLTAPLNFMRDTGINLPDPLGANDILLFSFRNLTDTRRSGSVTYPGSTLSMLDASTPAPDDQSPDEAVSATNALETAQGNSPDGFYRIRKTTTGRLYMQSHNNIHDDVELTVHVWVGTTRWGGIGTYGPVTASQSDTGYPLRDTAIDLPADMHAADLFLFVVENSTNTMRTESMIVTGGFLQSLVDIDAAAPTNTHVATFVVPQGNAANFYRFGRIGTRVWFWVNHIEEDNSLTFKLFRY